MHNAGGGLRLPTIGRDTSLCSHRLWRNTHLQWLTHRHRLQVPLQRIKTPKNMYIKLIRNQAQGIAITGRLVIDGRWYCNTLERVGYQIPALCYHVAVTQSPKFKRRLPIVQNVPRIANSEASNSREAASNSEASNRAKPVQYPAAECRTGIRIHRGTKPEHSTGCVLVPPEKECLLTYNILKAQNAHEEIILEVIDFTPGTEYGYNHPCPPELQKP